MSEVLLEARQLRVAVPKRALVENFDCSIRGGEFIALLGGNGAGKSLLLRTLAGLRAASGGRVLLDGKDLDSLPRRAIATRLGFLPQDPDAPPQGSLFESVLLGRHAHLGFWEANGPADEVRAAGALAEVGLTPLAHASWRRCPAASSGARRSPGCWCRGRLSTCSTSPPTISIRHSSSASSSTCAG